MGVANAVDGHSLVSPLHAALHPDPRHRHPQHQAKACLGECRGRHGLHHPCNQHHCLSAHGFCNIVSDQINRNNPHLVHPTLQVGPMHLIVLYFYCQKSAPFYKPLNNIELVANLNIFT